MHERQIEELLALGGEIRIETAAERVLGDRQGLVVGGEGARVAAEHVARHLIEQDAEREAALRAALPVLELAGRGAREQLARTACGSSGRTPDSAQTTRA